MALEWAACYFRVEDSARVSSLLAGGKTSFEALAKWRAHDDMDRLRALVDGKYIPEWLNTYRKAFESGAHESKHAHPTAKSAAQAWARLSSVAGTPPRVGSGSVCPYVRPVCLA